jgi:hypothetical protein
MESDSLDPYALESRGQANEREDRVEWQLGFDRPADAESRKWSGMA